MLEGSTVRRADCELEDGKASTNAQRGRKEIWCGFAIWRFEVTVSPRTRKGEGAEARRPRRKPLVIRSLVQEGAMGGKASTAKQGDATCRKVWFVALSLCLWANVGFSNATRKGKERAITQKQQQGLPHQQTTGCVLFPFPPHSTQKATSSCRLSLNLE